MSDLMLNAKSTPPLLRGRSRTELCFELQTLTRVFAEKASDGDLFAAVQLFERWSGVLEMASAVRVSPFKWAMGKTALQPLGYAKPRTIE